MGKPAKSRRIEIRVSEDEVLAERSRVVLGDEDAARFLAALDHPERFEPGLKWLAERPSVLSQ